MANRASDADLQKSSAPDFYHQSFFPVWVSSYIVIQEEIPLHAVFMMCPTAMIMALHNVPILHFNFKIEEQLRYKDRELFCRWRDMTNTNDLEPM
mmetsp:Transcript_20700/g.35569  ORF Transcript_20700/g.35569 Transcript_20700/m.35569 type:complete len:95 (+) Transcript_20700:1841-2125(+)|eukprot:CAMPEP_0184430974 /NCGR_PEP_ID=MMETSP0738-20130409/294757_1 /TAXON_ID=385413 /ORGANISM="Thalassiosira miniscula, Strain CCMP1093" /LENGTH=94 /DNA_ID=CAMNT_0026795759 /DNA_START=111 /DNA_END=395 /DNA_ORIENTATION=-